MKVYIVERCFTDGEFSWREKVGVYDNFEKALRKKSDSELEMHAMKQIPLPPHPDIHASTKDWLAYDAESDRLENATYYRECIIIEMEVQ